MIPFTPAGRVIRRLPLSTSYVNGRQQFIIDMPGVQYPDYATANQIADAMMLSESTIKKCIKALQLPFIYVIVNGTRFRAYSIGNAKKAIANYLDARWSK